MVDCAHEIFIETFWRSVHTYTLNLVFISISVYGCLNPYPKSFVWVCFFLSFQFFENLLFFHSLNWLLNVSVFESDAYRFPFLMFSYFLRRFHTIYVWYFECIVQNKKKFYEIKKKRTEKKNLVMLMYKFVWLNWHQKKKVQKNIGCFVQLTAIWWRFVLRFWCEWKRNRWQKHNTKFSALSTHNWWCRITYVFILGGSFVESIVSIWW